ncbi:MAG: tRNA adenosine(34) deaminase TadA [Micrococcaceae bacterium]
MEEALSQARQAGEAGEIAVGAVIARRGTIIARAGNTKEAKHDATCHAEINVIREASQQLKRWRLEDCTLYVTLEPCIMCAGAILAARIPHVVFGAWDEKAGAVGSQFDILRERRLNHQVEVKAGVMEHECTQLLHSFFQDLRQS